MRKIATFILLVALGSCKTQSQDLTVLFSFPKQQSEISGMVYHPQSSLLYTLEDKGNPNEIYVFTEKGTLQHTIAIGNVENTDWEDLSFDNSGNLYIGNFGNNDNKRTDLSISKIENSDLSNKNITTTQTTKFNYPEQSAFPPKKKDLLYDCEAFIATDSYFYLFTKNRSKGFDGSFFVYKVPNKPGEFKAEKIAELNSGNSYENAAITGAAYNSESKTIAITTHSKVLLIPFKDDSSFNQENIKSLEYNHVSQKEAITFKDNKTLYIADEKEKKDDVGGNVYVFKLPN